MDNGGNKVEEGDSEDFQLDLTKAEKQRETIIVA